jgi:hypothetical protein
VEVLVFLGIERTQCFGDAPVAAAVPRVGAPPGDPVAEDLVD